MRGCAAKRSAKIMALAHIRSKRTSSVSRPRCKSHASNAPGTDPDSLRHSATRAIKATSRPETWPYSTSEWPAGALVSAATTRSAPKSSGRCNRAVMVVLSTINFAPTAWALRAAKDRSQQSSPGLDGVSTKTTEAPVKSAPSMSAVAIRRTFTPKGAKNCSVSNRVV